MKKKHSQYQKLTGWSIRFMGTYQLFMGEGHLLLVNSIIFSESYKRLYFKDIQAIFLRKTNKYMIRMVTLSIVSLIFLLFALYLSNKASYFFFFMTVSGISFLIRDLIKGPTCECVMKTAVQIIKIPSINREKKAFQVLSKIKPIIVTEQKEIKKDQLSLDGHPNKNIGFIQKANIVQPKKQESGLVHITLFSVLFIQGGLFMASLFKYHSAINAILILTFLAIFILSIIGMIKQIGSNLTSFAKTNTVLVLIFTVLESVVFYFCIIFHFIQKFATSSSGMPSPTMFNFSMIQLLIDFSPHTNIGFFFLFLICGVLSLFISTTGLIAIYNHRELMKDAINVEVQTDSQRENL